MFTEGHVGGRPGVALALQQEDALLPGVGVKGSRRGRPVPKQVPSLTAFPLALKPLRCSLCI